MEEEFLDEIDFSNGEPGFVELNIEEPEISFKTLEHSKATMNLLSGVQSTKKRELTYDDILGSMNLKVVDGQLQYIQPQKVANPVKTVKFSAPVEKEKQQGANPRYLNYIPRSKEEHEKMMRENMRENMKKQMVARARHQKSTKLLFTNNLPQPPMPNVTGGNHFLQFVKVRPAMRPLR
jgi:hypothetical protein